MDNNRNFKKYWIPILIAILDEYQWEFTKKKTIDWCSDQRKQPFRLVYILVGKTENMNYDVICDVKISHLQLFVTWHVSRKRQSHFKKRYVTCRLQSVVTCKAIL